MNSEKLIGNCIRYETNEEAIKILKVIEKYHKRVKWEYCDIVVDQSYNYINCRSNYIIFLYRGDYEFDDIDADIVMFLEKKPTGKILTIDDLTNNRYEKLLKKYKL